jgi:hypothetical protein
MLELEQLEHAARLRRRCHHLQAATLVRQQQAGRGHVEQGHAVVGEPVEQVRDVVVGDQAVGQGDERLTQLSFVAHRCLRCVHTPSSDPGTL